MDGNGEVSIILFQAVSGKKKKNLPHECRSQYLVKEGMFGIILTPMTSQCGRG